ncbi:MAG TPA: class I SAM-dependent methyltransferase [Bacteroidales bacterium]|nr:class I SAM-dependent methyltransferase [Bacteroidales bacterium]HSA42760.1 class I SAM-dependent methyltransferase [Bacteroidales bacterium]
MKFLTASEITEWSGIRDRIVYESLEPAPHLTEPIRPGLRNAFHYFAGTCLLTKGKQDLGRHWILAGVAGEEGGLFSNSFMASYLQRTDGKLLIPETIFEDARPFIHFAGVPVMKSSRDTFVNQCARALPAFNKPLKIMDIGCGHGALLVQLVQQLRMHGLVNEVAEFLLIDPSADMLRLAEKNVSDAFPAAKVHKGQYRIQEFSDKVTGSYDIALASLSYHHMPYETKAEHLKKLSRHIRFFLLFELDANNDTPELHSPELALSLYQSYGAIMDFIFSHDAPVEVAVASIDKFLMAEAVSFLTEPRGIRTDYHMLRNQWHDVFREGLGAGFECVADSICYGDENVGLFTMIYGPGS